MENIATKVLRRLKLSGVYEHAERAFFPTAFDKQYGSRNEFLLNLRGVSVRYSTADQYSKKWFFPRYDRGHYHEPALTNVFIDEIKPGSCVFDIGAHLGYFTCLAGVLCQNGFVHAFEVDDHCIPRLKRNIRINNLTNVTLNNLAVSDNDLYEKIPRQHQPSPGLKIAKDNGHRVKKVKAITVDKYLERNNIMPDVIKIDVEGAEYKVLKGMPETLKLPALKMLIEVHEKKLEMLNSNYREVIKLLLNNNFMLREIVEHRSEDVIFRELNENAKLYGDAMIFATKSIDLA